MRSLLLVVVCLVVVGCADPGATSDGTNGRDDVAGAPKDPSRPAVFHPPPHVVLPDPHTTPGTDGNPNRDPNDNIGCQNAGVCGPSGTWDAAACACVYTIQECGAGRILDIYTNQCGQAPGTSCADGTVSVGVPCPQPTPLHTAPVRTPRNPCQQCNQEQSDCKRSATQELNVCEHQFADVVATEFCRQGIFPDWSKVPVSRPPCTYDTDRATGVTHQVCPDNVILPGGCADAWHRGMAGHAVSGTVTRGGDIQFDGSIDGKVFKVGAAIGGKIESADGQTTTFEPAKGLDAVCGQRYVDNSRRCTQDCTQVCR